MPKKPAKPNGEDRLAYIERLAQQDAENIHELALVAAEHQKRLDEHERAMEELRDLHAQMVREWTAYLRRSKVQ